MGLEEEGVEEEDGGVDEGEPQVKGEKVSLIISVFIYSLLQPPQASSPAITSVAVRA